MPPSVTQLWRYPVKSMAGERVEQARITVETGVLGDRSYALLDVETGRIASAKNPRNWAPLLAYRAHVVENEGERHPRVAIELPDGTVIRSDANNVDAVLSKTIGRTVRLVSSPPEQGRYDEYNEGLARSTAEPLAVGAPEGTFFDFASLHIVTTGTLARLAALRPDSRFEIARFRPNLVVDSQDVGFHENDWVGHEIAIGDEVRAYVTFPTPRCVMTTLAQPDLPHDPQVLKTATANTLMFPLLAKKLPSVGIYATIVRGGTVRPGDTVRVQGTSLRRRVGTYAHAVKRAIRRR